MKWQITKKSRNCNAKPPCFRSGNLAARNARLENPAHPVRYQGVVCSMKDSFGFIERADVVKEIFFHFSEAKGMKEDLSLGDDVEFTIQTRNVI
jgi:cold shock CspA family protein